MPSTHIGRWSAWLLAASVALMFVFVGLVASGQRGGDTFFSNLTLTLPVMAAGAAAMCGGCVGLAAWRGRDRSVLVVISIIVGGLVLFWSAAEIFLPH